MSEEKPRKFNEEEVLKEWLEEIKHIGCSIDIYEPRGSGDMMSIAELLKALDDPTGFESDTFCSPEAYDAEAEYFEAYFKDFLKENFDEKFLREGETASLEGSEETMDADDIFDAISDMDQFRIPFEENCIKQNITDSFNYEVLIVKPIDVGRLEDDEEEAWKILQRYVSKQGFKEVELNTAYMNGYWFVGAIVSAKELLDQAIDGKKSFEVESSIVGVHDGLNGDAFFVKAEPVKMFVKLKRSSCSDKDETIAHIDHGEYGIGGVFGTHDWKWK